MRNWRRLWGWTWRYGGSPTAEGYFKHVSKAVILDAVGEFAPEQVSRLAKLKKTDIASEAERLTEGTGWMPAVFKAEDVENRAQKESEAGSQQDDGDENAEGAEDSVAAIKREAEELAA